MVHVRFSGNQPLAQPYDFHNIEGDPVYQYVYISNPSVGFDDARLASLLTTARAANQANDITGVLLFSGNSFVQCIEGCNETVQRLAENIRGDTRHKNLIVLHEGEVSERSFAQWFMGCAFIGESDLLKLAQAEWSNVATTAKNSTKTTGQELLCEFWSIFREGSLASTA